MSIIHEKLLELEEDMRLCYPGSWNKISRTNRAKVISKQFAAIYPGLVSQLRAIREAEKTRKIDLEAKAKKRKRDYHSKWNNVIMKAHGFYGDMLHEYSMQINGEDGAEMLCSGAWQPSDSIEEECMMDALYAAHAVNAIDNPKFYETAMRFWKKYWR